MDELHLRQMLKVSWISQIFSDKVPHWEEILPNELKGYGNKHWIFVIKTWLHNRYLEKNVCVLNIDLYSNFPVTFKRSCSIYQVGPV